MTLRTKAENLTLRAHCCAAPGKKGASTRASRASQSRGSSKVREGKQGGKSRRQRPSHQQWEESRAGLATASSLLPGDLGSEFENKIMLVLYKVVKLPTIVNFVN